MYPPQPVPTVMSPGGQTVQANTTLTASGSSLFSGFGAGAVTLIIDVTVSPTGTTPTLQYTLQEIDPGDNTTVFGSTASSTVINAIGIQSVTLSGVKGGSIKVSWTVTGGTPSFTGVYVTLGQGGASGGTSVDQGTAAALSGGWPVKMTDGTSVLGTGAAPVRTDPTGTTTQPVSLATAPLPTGAATAANQTTLGNQTTKLNDGTNTAAVTAASALKVDGSAVTQPVSGTVTANIGTSGSLALDATLTAGTQQTRITDGTDIADVTAANALKVDGSAVTQPVSAASLPLPTGAATATNQTTLGSQTTKINDGTTTVAVTVGNALQVDASATTQPVSAASLPLPSGASTSANQTTVGSQTTKLNDGTNTAAVSAANALKVDGSAVTQPVSGTVTANIGTSGALALDATLTGGTQKAIIRGGAKGSTTAADVTSTASGANHQPVDVAIYDAAGNQITSFGGGTQYTVNDPAPADPIGPTLVAERDDQLSTLSEVEGDWTQVRASAKGALWVTIPDTNGDPITSFGGGTQFADGAVRGTATGTLAMVDDGTLIQSTAGDSSGRQIIVGAAADAAAVAGNPLLIGGSDGANARTVNVDSTGALRVQAGGATGAAVPARALQVAGSDGTNLRALRTATDGTVRTDPTGTTTQPVSGTVTAAQGTAAALAGRWPVIVTDGTNSMPTMDTVGRRGFMTITDGTNSLPTGDALARAIFVRQTDGTNNATIKAASTEAAAADTSLVVALSPNSAGPFEFGGDSRLRVGQESMALFDTFEGAAVDTRWWTASQSGMTQTVGSGILTLNAGASLTSGNYSILNSTKNIRFSVEFGIYYQCRARVIAFANVTQEFGIGSVATNAAPTNGGFFRMVGTTLTGVINNGGTETSTATLATLANASYYSFEIFYFEASVKFEVMGADGVVAAEATIQVPMGQPSFANSAAMPAFFRTYNTAAAGTAGQLLVGSVAITSMDSLPVFLDTSSITSVTSSATSVNLVTSNPNRKRAIIFNDSTQALYVKYGTTASTTSFSYYMTPKSTLVIEQNEWVGNIDGIWSSANGNARITEVM